MDSLSETLDKALHIVKAECKVGDDKVDKDENDRIEEEGDCEMKLTFDGDRKLDCKESSNNSATESHEIVNEVNTGETSNCSEKISMDNERNTESVGLPGSDRTNVHVDKSYEKHVSFKVDQNSDSDHVTDDNHVSVEKSCDVSAQFNIEHSDHENQLDKTETQTNKSSPNGIDDNNSALTTKDNMPAIIEQNRAKIDEEKHNGALNENEDASVVTNTKGAVGKEKELTIDSYVSDNMLNEDSEMSEKELKDLHVRVDIFRFLLPGLCHLTSEDLPRMVLIKEGILALLDLYMWRQWNLFLKNPQSREVQVNNNEPCHEKKDLSTEEQIRRVFCDNSRIIFVSSP